MKQDSSQFNSADPPSEKAIQAAAEAIRKAQLPIGYKGPRVSCSDLRALVDIRLDEACLLIDKGLPCGAYYLAGYAVELALKVRIAESVQRCEFPSVTLANAACRHNLVQLINLAGLAKEYDCKVKPYAPLRDNWETVLGWSETSRYDAGIALSSAIGLIEAISEPDDGVLNWIKQYWSATQ